MSYFVFVIYAIPIIKNVKTHLNGTFKKEDKI